jgi:hypothetical protein
MTIIQAVMLALMPSMAVFAMLLCKPAFRRVREPKQDVSSRSRPSKSGAYRSFPSFAGMDVSAPSAMTKARQDRTSVRRG